MAKADDGGDFDGLARPLQRALARAGITSLAELSSVPRAELIGMHGLGKRGLELLQQRLAAKGLSPPP
jgi:hypothetical protein